MDVWKNKRSVRLPKKGIIITTIFIAGFTSHGCGVKGRPLPPQESPPISAGLTDEPVSASEQENLLDEDLILNKKKQKQQNGTTTAPQE